MLTDLLEIVALVLLVVAAGMTFGVAAALAAAGVACLVASWSLAR